jgi:hypothetical protein
MSVFQHKEVHEYMKKKLEESELLKRMSNVMVLNWMPGQIHHSSVVSLYDYLKTKGYSELSYPRTKLDKLAKNNKFIRFFHKPHISIDRNVLVKGRISFFFDVWHVDVIKDKKVIMTFKDNVDDQEILSYLKNLEREMKLERICKK